MELEVTFVIYLMIFRLAIIFAGIVSIVLGYRLFIHGIDGTEKGSSLDSSFAGMKIKLQNAAPGTFFAVFGVIIISVMLVSNPPSYESVQHGKQEGQIAETTSTLKFRSSKNLSKEALEAGKAFIDEQKYIEAISVFSAALKQLDAEQDISSLLNQLAWAYFKQDHNLDEALILSRFACYQNPKKADFLDTQAEILFALGNKKDALKIIEKAIQLDAGLTQKLPRFQNQ